MNIHKVIQRRIRSKAGGVDIAGDVNAVIAANVGEPGSSSAVSSSQRIVQRSRKTAVAAEANDQAEEEPHA